jgi:hypothetical protein
MIVKNAPVWLLEENYIMNARLTLNPTTHFRRGAVEELFFLDSRQTFGPNLCSYDNVRREIGQRMRGRKSLSSPKLLKRLIRKFEGVKEF